MRTDNEKLKFLEKFRESGSVIGACNQTNTPRSDIYRWRKENKKFNEKFNEAKEEAVGIVCDMAELQLSAAVKRGESWAIRYVLDNNHPSYIKPRLPQPREKHQCITEFVTSIYNPSDYAISPVKESDKTTIKKNAHRSLK